MKEIKNRKEKQKKQKKGIKGHEDPFQPSSANGPRPSSSNPNWYLLFHPFSLTGGPHLSGSSSTPT
jgi:hypothetical protein